MTDRIKELENENALLKHDCDASQGALRVLATALEVESWKAVLEMEAKINTMKKALEQAKKALEYIAYPLDSMHKKLKQGETLSDFAIYMAKDADYLKSIARDANNQLADVLGGQAD